MAAQIRHILFVASVLTIAGVLIFAACAPAPTPEQRDQIMATGVIDTGITINPDLLVIPSKASVEDLRIAKEVFLTNDATKVSSLNDIAIARNEASQSSISGASLNWDDSKVSYRVDSGNIIPEAIAVPVKSSDPEAFSPQKIETLKAAGIKGKIILGGVILLNDVGNFKSGEYTIEYSLENDEVCIVNPLGVCEYPTYCIDTPEVLTPSVDFHNTWGICVTFHKWTCCI